MSYGYRLFKYGRDQEKRRYTWNELRDMGTFMLRDICCEEKIMTKSAGIDPKRLNRDELLALLFRYRGREEAVLADEFSEEAAEILRSLSAMTMMAAEKLEVPHKIQMKKGIPLSEAEDVMIRHGFAGSYFVGTLSDAQGNVLAVFEVRGERMSLSPKRISESLPTGICQDLTCLLFDEASSRKVIRAYNSQKCDPVKERGLVAAMTRLPILSVSEVEDTKDALVIDFGAGHTALSAADTEKDTILEVRFQEGKRLCPSVAAVRRCTEGGAEFCFGYEAMRLLRRDGYGRSMTFFHNLKLFLFEERRLDVCDGDGNAAVVSSDQLLQAFLESLISLARGEHGRNYTKLCFLLPEKRSNLALSRLRSLLPGYQVEGVYSESVNCVYREMLRQEAYQGEDAVTDLVFHCGAGSASLVACEHEAENTGVAYQVWLKERYLNGEQGFGGNRLTCLIFMYLKIRIMLAVTGSGEAVLDEKFQDAYSSVDQYGGTKEVYQSFLQLYEQAEETVPTRFDSGEKGGIYRRQNFYRLWFLAEGLKLAFFSGEPVSTIDLPDRFPELCAVFARDIQGDEEYRVKLSIQKEELELVMAPEIYRIVKRFVEPLCNEYGILMGYRIKFTGMSCQIPVFRDALREFTVGRRARLKRGEAEGLKLRALEGVILRGQMEKNGRIIPEITEEEAEISYRVTAEAYDGTVQTIAAQDWTDREVFGYIRRHAATRQVEFTIWDSLGNEAGRRVVTLDIGGFTQTAYDTLFSGLPVFRQVQGDFDAIGEAEIRLFVYREENWDFCVLPAARKQGILCVGQVNRFLFDEDCVDYFSGRL